MKNKILSSILSCVVAVTLLFTNIVCVTADGEATNVIGIKHYLNDTLLEDGGVVFVGEVFKTHVYADKMATFTSWGMDLHFDNSRVQLVPFSFEDDQTPVDSVVVGDEFDLWEGMYGVKAAVLDTWANGAGKLAVNGDMPYISNDEGYIWLYGYVESTGNSAGLPDESTILELNFKANAAGDTADIRFASQDDDIFDIGTPGGVKFVFGDANSLQSLPLTKSINTVKILERPEEPAVRWSENVAKWDPVISRGYVVDLYKEGVDDPVATSGNLETDVTEYDFSSALTTPGNYYFVVTAKGGTNNTESLPSGVNSITIKLDTPETPAWDTTTSGKLIWTPVDNAVNYEVTIYKKNGETGSFDVLETVPVLGENSVELKEKMSEVGEYKATVKALDTGTGYTESATSEMSGSFYSGTKINGYVWLDHLNKSNEDHKLKNGGMNVSLYALSTDGEGKTVRTLADDAVSNNDGSFGFNAVLAGNYDIVISANGVVTRIIENVAISGENFVLSTEDTPIELWPGNIYIDDDMTASEQYPYGVTYVNTDDITAMIKLLGTSETNDKYNPVADYDYIGGNSAPDLTVLLKYAGKNSVPGDRSSYPTWVIPQ